MPCFAPRKLEHRRVAQRGANLKWPPFRREMRRKKPIATAGVESRNKQTCPLANSKSAD